MAVAHTAILFGSLEPHCQSSSHWTDHFDGNFRSIPQADEDVDRLGRALSGCFGRLAAWGLCMGPYDTTRPGSGMHVDSVFNVGLLPVSAGDAVALQAADAVVRYGLAAFAARIVRANLSSAVATGDHAAAAAAVSGTAQPSGTPADSAATALHPASATCTSGQDADEPVLPAPPTLIEARSAAVEALISATAAALGRRPRHERAQASIAPPPTPPSGTSARTSPGMAEDDREYSSAAEDHDAVGPAAAPAADIADMHTDTESNSSSH